jgi:transcription elongation factor Elf1
MTIYCIFTSLAYGLSEVSINASDALGEQCGLSLKILVRDASQEVDVYPNPVRDILYLRTGSKTDADVNITGISGESVYNKKVTIDPFEPANIDMTGISAGFYSVKIKTGDKVITRKIVKL